MKKNKGNTSIGLELDRQAYHKREASQVITDYSRMLESPKERHKVGMMRELNWDQAITRVQTEKGEEIERTSVSDSLKAPVSKLDEIQDIAVSYDLKFLPADKFRCPEKREYEMTSLLSDFMEERGIDNTAFSKHNFFILADERYFLSRQVDIDDEVGVFIFYRPPKQTQNFVRVDSIGSGRLTFSRYLRGWRHKDLANYILHGALVTFAVAFPLLTLLSGGSFWKPLIGSVIICALPCVAAFNAMKKRGGPSLETWNKPVQS